MGVTSLSLSDSQKILYELNQAQPCFNETGTITKEAIWNYFVSRLREHPQPRWMVLIQKMNQIFSRLEQKGIKHFDSSIKDKAFLEKARCYRDDKQTYLNIVRQIDEHIKSIKNVDPELKKAHHELRCREVGLRYSLGKENGGLDPLEAADAKLFKEIIARAHEWKYKQKFALENGLNALQREQLEELAKYPQWLAVAIEDPDYLSEVFNWSLQNFQSVEIIVKNYEMRRKIKAALLPANLGYARNVFLTRPQDEVLAYRTVSTKCDHISKRILTAAIYHGSFKKFEAEKQERINILKPNQTIHFKQGNYHLTVEEFLRELGQKNKREANVNLCGEWGFINFHPVKGVWNVDQQRYVMPALTAGNWVDYVPPARIASHEELVEQYGKDIDRRDFFFKVMASRQHNDLNAFDSHAYFQVFTRMADGNWKVLNVGLYPFRFLQGALDGLSFFCDSVRRVVALLDQNAYYSHRQQAGFPIFCSEDAKNGLLKRIFDVIHTKGVFQCVGHNCAAFIQDIVQDLMDEELIEEQLPNFFRMPLTKIKTGIPPLDGLLYVLDFQAEWIRNLFLNLIQKCFLSHRSLCIDEKHYSVQNYFSQNGYEIYNPSYLPWKIQKAHLKGKGEFFKGELYWSHTDEKRFQKMALLTEMQKNNRLPEDDDLLF